MSELIRNLENLYEKFILRDILSFILPGALVTFSLMSLVMSKTNIFEITKSLPWVSYIILFGFFYLFGFAIQCFAEALLILLNPSISNKIYFLKEEDAKHLRKLAKIFKEEVDKLKLRERYVVFKQMCRNSAFAILLSMVILNFKIKWFDTPEHIVIFGCLILVSLFLLIGFIFHKGRLEMWDSILSDEKEID